MKGEFPFLRLDAVLLPDFFWLSSSLWSTSSADKLYFFVPRVSFVS